MNLEIRKQPTTELRKVSQPRDLGAGLEQLVQFADDMRSVEQALSALSELAGSNSSKTISRLCKELTEFEPTITVLGQVKAGKTALVNAMAGWTDLLPSDVNPWTSVVTSLHLKPGTERSENGARFRFMTEQEWDRLLNKGGRMGELASRAGAESELQKIGEQIEAVREKARLRLGKKFELLIGEEHDYGYFDKNLLEKYICMGDDFQDEDASPETADQGRFADILRSADLYLNSVTVPCNLCLRDTPGVNDTFMMREQITVQAIRESRLCVVVLSANQALTSVDMGLIRLISNLKTRNIVIFVNRIDDLSAPSEQIPEIERSIRDTLKKQQGPENVEIVFGSAYWAGIALSGDINKLPDASANALFDWAQVALDPKHSETQPHKMVWELSGLPALFRALSDRIVSDLGQPLLKKVSEAAVTVATSEQAAENIRLKGVKETSITPQQAVEVLNQLSVRHVSALRDELQTAVTDYQERADRAHAQFIERASQSLISHLEEYGPMASWKYDPTGLRVLMRSAYSVFGKRTKTLALQCYENALMDIAKLYSHTFGEFVDGIQMSVPEAPELPAPVTLGQTIALDFNDGWWVSWWKRLRGYEAFAKQFRQLIAGETEDFMIQLKSVQADLVCQQFVDRLSEFLENQKDVLAEFEAASAQGKSPNHAIPQNDNTMHADKIEAVLGRLQRFTNSERKAI